MARIKATKSEREPIGEPTTEHAAETTASVRQYVAESSRARIWEMHLRGTPKARIATALGIHRATVARIITACYAEVASDQKKFSPARKLGEAVARMRRVQEQAWDDHDEDDERERQVLDLSLAQQQPSDGDGKDGKPGASIRYQSQRSQYLRIILDAEKEIARLEGLYEGLLDVEGGVLFRIVRDDTRQPERQQSGLLAFSAPNTPMLPAGGNSSDSENGATGDEV